MFSSQSDMSTPKKTRLASSIDDDESFVISISKSLKKRFLEKDAATSLIESKKDAAIADIESEFSELKRQLLKRPSKTTTVKIIYAQITCSDL